MRSYVAITFCLLWVCVLCQNENASENGTSTTSDKVVSTTESPLSNNTCNEHDGNCEACIKNSKCYFCQDSKKCNVYSVSISKVFPDECKVKSMNYGTCAFSMLVEIILIGVAAAILLIAIIACCCCYCCKSGGRIKLSKDDLKWARQREERRIRSEEKRKERAERTAEIKKKYGLFKDDTPYQRFDA